MEASWPALRFFAFLLSTLMLFLGTLLFYAEKGELMITKEAPNGAYYRSVMALPPSPSSLPPSLPPLHPHVVF